MIASWIFKQNLQPFLHMLAWIAGYDASDFDYNAVEHGIDGTDNEKENWFNYEFIGSKRRIVFKAADDPGSSVLHFRILAPHDANELVELAFIIASEADVQLH
jgi:hypothetical protein